MKNEIKKILQDFIEVKNELDLLVDNEVLFENAVKLYISEQISKQKSNSFAKSGQVGKSVPSKEVSDVIKGSDRPTIKQIEFLKKHIKKDVISKLTKKEATQMISEYINKLKEEKK